MKLTHICFHPDENLKHKMMIKWRTNRGRIFNSEYHYYIIMMHPIKILKSCRVLFDFLKRKEYTKETIHNWVDLETGKVTDKRYDHIWGIKGRI